MAEEALTTFEDDLKVLLQTYCADTQFAVRQVTAFLEDLPRHKEPTINAFIAWRILVHTRNVLKDITGADLDLSAAREGGRGLVDDEEVRRSAGFTPGLDKAVSDTARPDRARELDIGDDDVAASAREGVSYRDQTARVPSRMLTFMKESRRLICGILQQCVRDDRMTLIEAASISQGNEGLSTLVPQIRALMGKLLPPSDESV